MRTLAIDNTRLKNLQSCWEIQNLNLESPGLPAKTFRPLIVAKNLSELFWGSVCQPLRFRTLNWQIGRFPGREATGNFADGIKSTGLQHTRGDRRAVASSTVDQQGAISRQGS